MALPRNDSASIISSLQMDYGDSDEEENDSKQNSSIDKKEESDTIQMKVAGSPEHSVVTSVKEEQQAMDVEKPDYDDKVKDSPMDNISDDDEHDSHTSSHHKGHHHHHHHRRHSKDAKEDVKPKDIYSEALNTDSPASQGSVSRKINKKATSLVSYGHDEDVGSDEEESEEEEVEEEADDASNDDSPALNASDASTLSRSIQNMSHDDIRIPPEPSGKCPYPLQRTIEKEYEKMRREGVDHNKLMQEKKSFRNPSIYKKLIEFCRIDENGTNFPPEIYNPHLWGKESFYDELDKVQRKDMERREKEKKDRTKIEFMTGTKKPTSQQDSQGGPDEKKRKTKWDAQPGSGNIQAQYAKLPAGQQNPGVVNLTATATGTKGKVISAVGSLSKKPSSK